MSGPKVVRVVTREELVAAGVALLARLDAALGEWERCAASVGASDSDRRASKDRRDALERMLRADKFGGFARAATDEIAFLEVDAEKRVERAAQARAQERSRLESGRELAGFLLRQLVSSSQERAGLERAAAGELDLKELDSVLARARQALFQSSDLKATDAQKALAARLSAGEKAEDIEAWRARSVSASARVTTLLNHVANLELLGAGEEAVQLQREVQAACAIKDEGVRGMRLDSLLVALTKAREGALVMARLRRQAALLAAEAAQVASGAELIKSLAAAGNASQDELQAVVQSAQTRLEEIRATSAAEFRRRAVLAGLQQLGYEVQEQLSTVTSTGGRLVVRGAAESTYGVEITAGAGMERMQVRTVALEAGLDASGDVQAEQRWCGDFGELQKRLKAQGTEVIIEKALGVGAVAVRGGKGCPRRGPESSRSCQADDSWRPIEEPDAGGERFSRRICARLQVSASAGAGRLKGAPSQERLIPSNRRSCGLSGHPEALKS